MIILTTWLTILSNTITVKADLVLAVGECLDRLLLADLAFWVNNQVFNISAPTTTVDLYYERFTTSSHVEQV